MRRPVVAALVEDETSPPIRSLRQAGGQPEDCVREPARRRAGAVQADKRVALRGPQDR